MKPVVYEATREFAATSVHHPEPGPGEVPLRVEMARAHGTSSHRHPGTPFSADDYAGALSVLRHDPACLKALAP
jgi:hypothetical protein